ncbi:MAG TPA: hypothetical protein VM938_03380 [Acidimicrobiales bacterium]|nr:hypothetical protein [Acidimicrobiales bacterium]
MIPLYVLATVTGIGLLAGAEWPTAVRYGLAAMLALTASAHFGSRRRDLIAMVPPRLPRPDLLVTITGVAELAIAAGLLFERSAPVAAAALVVLLVAMFPANVHAVRANVGIGGRPPTPLRTRSVIQAAFVAAAIGAL